MKLQRTYKFFDFLSPRKFLWFLSTHNLILRDLMIFLKKTKLFSNAFKRENTIECRILEN